MANSPCPLCTNALKHPEEINVCSGCYESLQMVGSVDITQTREFSLAPQHEPVTTSPPVATSTTGAQCAWCKKNQSEVKRLISQNSVHVCNECVGLCVEVLSAEFGDAWRKS